MAINFKPSWPLTPVSRALTALFFIATGSSAQTVGSLKPVLITERSAAVHADITGFGDTALKDLPLSASVISRDQLEATGARRLADITQFDSSISDAYNSPGYWDYLSVRGFVIDNRFNYRREGLPISAETTIALENKERIEVLKGTSGIQAGTSAPGGLVNLVVKRPTQKDLRELRLETSGAGSVLVALDLGGRAGTEQALGYRINVAHEDLKPQARNLNGVRDLLALAADWRISADSVLEAEVEWSRKSQPSQAGFSLLGNVLPAPVDPNRNLNNQPWSQASDFEGLYGTLRFEQAINKDWRWSAQLGHQALKNNDRVAFPFGCTDVNGVDYYPDRFCPNGDFDVYDFRSENEQRTQRSASLALKGKLMLGSVVHDIGLGLLSSAVQQRFQMQAYNYAGSGNIAATTTTPSAPVPGDQNTNRDERSLEFSVHDAVRWNDQLTTWLGLRQTQLHRDSVRTNGSRPTSYSDSLATPWLATSYALSAGQTVYASYGEGIESQVVPNKASQYTNAGLALPALKSRQWEVGIKGAIPDLGWQLAWFSIVRPMTNLDACSRLGVTPCLGAYDGQARHQGLEASAQWARGPARVGASATLLNATREGSVLEPALNGQAPSNVPKWVLRANVAWRVSSIPGLEIQGQASQEGPRSVLPDGSVTLPAWSRLDASLSYQTKSAWGATSWTLGVDNLLDNRYWKESPYQWGHIYLFPGAERNLRLGMKTSF